MKKNNYKISCLQFMAVNFTILVIAILLVLNAKSSPILPAQRQLVFNRAKSLDNGISISWLEQTWNNDILNTEGIKATDLQLLKKLGFKSIRLPVAFKNFEKKNIPLKEVLARIDKAWKLCRKYGFKMIIDYHYGDLNDNNFVTETNEVIKTWTVIAKKYHNTAEDDLFFELYNEPPPINPQVWKDAAYNMVEAIRKVDSGRTLLVGASNYNSIYELSRFVRLKDENIIYTFHFYEPFLFTHQGADWVGDQMATTGVGFPYSVDKFPQINPKAKGTAGEANYNKYHLDGNEGSVRDKLQIVKNWANKYNVPILCGEYGSYDKYADAESRCRYTKTVRHYLKQLGIPGILWDYNTNFSIFTNEQPSLENLSDCMRDAIGYKSEP
ncbi:glycoside hydrolase family 5 protein [Mucilaginibacter boryungensis]|uniref:Cellulase family glycosylhydrolase n=1 Tax=Mucilaginibacter boryungensis TaxID=768480 RepID=A0ABR9XJ65_9SPHI|nr:cellulase family glycosylhydrolase [Mucilaginibacter boryungensis]MBE9667245.1 cellulase family glycosylhydrolase [Mucilaginibacter boryungensis]